jgi:hypothetical protein
MVHEGFIRKILAVNLRLAIPELRHFSFWMMKIRAVADLVRKMTAPGMSNLFMIGIS